MSSQKTQIIENIFNERWNEERAALSLAVVTLEDVGGAIREYNASLPPDEAKLSDRNPANFFKDFVRRRARANENWPESVRARGYTARQRTGRGQCFEFVPLPEAGGEAFPPACPPPDEDTPTHRIQSASLPPLSRRLGRTDEPWLLQVLIRLRVLETHLVLESPRNIIYVDHLQMNVKLRESEIDALFLATEQLEGDSTRELILTFEAKRTDDILGDQILGQVRAVFEAQSEHDIVIPLAAKTEGSQVYVVEFEAISRPSQPDQPLPELRVASSALYKLEPDVPGIS